MKNAAIMGYGTIGSGVAEILEQNKDVIAKAAGEEIQLKYVLDLREFPGSRIEDKLVHDFSVIEQDEDVQIVVETMGGLNPAYPFVKSCLLAGKHVVTSNKALVAAHGSELLAIAREKQVNFFFEASVGGGIPIIRTLHDCLMGERVEEITGILNGTTNFILTKMDKEGWAFESALKEAQRLGYAEQNPEADVEGHDTCRKIAILTSMAVGKEVNYQDIYTEGITKITDTDFQYAEKMGMSIKLTGTSKIGADGTVRAYVLPLMIEKENPLYTVSDVFNGIVVKGNMLGTSMYYGSGAGKLPTASAVVADMIHQVKNAGRNVPMGWTDEKQMIAPMEKNEFQYFIRIAGEPEDMLPQIKDFGAGEVISIGRPDEFAIVSRKMQEEEFQKAAAKLEGVRSVIRMEL